MPADNQNWFSIVIRVLLFLAFSAGAVFCVYLISGSDLSNRESALFGVIVTILSVLASWILTDVYATSQYRVALREVKAEHTRSLRTYALKAAEKVNNLSSELHKLSVYLEEELSYTEYRSADEELLAKEERMESAIHVIRTLKSINDTGLSDWEGVIGDELSQQREEQAAKEDELKELMERVESVIEDQRQESTGTRMMRRELENLRRELRLATFQLNETTVPKRIRKNEPKVRVSTPCPACNALVNYRQRARINSYKPVSCGACGAKSIATYADGGGFTLRLRQEEEVNVQCAHCGASDTCNLDNYPSFSVLRTCTKCGGLSRIIRSNSGVDVRAATSKDPVMPLSEEIIDRVRDAMPAQPWPTGTHLQVAQQLGLPASVVRRSVSELIKRSVFKQQIDGVLHPPS